MLRAPAVDFLVLAMTRRDDELRVRPGRIRDKSFVGQVMRAAKKAGHTGKRFGGGKRASGRSTFGRGRRAALSLSARSNSRRVVVKARVVRHQGTRFRSAPLATHLKYLQREGVTREGEDAHMFDANCDDADAKAFADRCVDDRHHFRFIVSPEDAARISDLRAFTRDLMRDAERDLGTKLDWVAVDHWNTDNPHIHVLVRGRGDDNKDLVISRDYISRGFRARAAQRVQIELGPRTEQEINAALQSETGAEHWTALDGALQAAVDEGAGIADLRPGGSGSEDTRLVLVGRAAKLKRLGLADQISPGRWTLKPNLELTLRELSVRGDIIKTMHRALSGGGREADVSSFALHGGAPAEPVLGRLHARGLHDELNGAAYAIIEGVDGRTHHVRFSSVEMTGDAPLGAIVETRTYDDAKGRKQVSLAVRSDLSIETQVTAPGATWLDRRLLDRDAIASNAAFGAEVGAAMEQRADHLIAQGLAKRQNDRVLFSRDLLATLRRRDMDEAVAKLSAETGLAHQPSAEGEHVSGRYRTRLILASGRFAMIDDGLGFQLVPWRPALEQQLGQHVSGVMVRGGGVEWNLGRRRGLGL
jgi:type IV secretory pathway VirD2 relaxase